MADSKGPRGLYIVFVAIIIVTVVMLVALVFGAAFMAANRAQFGQIVNNASLAALERFVRYGGSSSSEPTYYQRATAALTQANERILDVQSLRSMGSMQHLGQLGFGPPEGPGDTGGLILFGTWLPEDPDPLNTSDCRPDHPNYPCLRVSESDNPPTGGSPASQINAVLIRANAPSPFNIPLANFVGGIAGLSTTAQGTAAVAPRCVVLALDASLSTTEESHNDVVLDLNSDGNPDIFDAPIPANPNSGLCCAQPPCSGDSQNPHGKYPKKYLCPRDASLFAFQESKGLSGVVPGSAYADPSADPICGEGGSGYTNLEGQIWCNMAWVNHDFNLANSKYRCRIYNNYRKCFPSPGGAGPDPENPHHPDDYKVRTGTPYGTLVVDTYTMPQPLATFLGAFNSSIQLLQSQGASSDRAKFLAFKGDIIDEYPGTGRGFTKDLGYLEQLTHTENYGYQGRTEIQPNFISRGWFGLAVGDPSQGSNILATLRQARILLADQSLCPPSAIKSVIIATDGVTNCIPSGSGWACDKPWSFYREAEKELLFGPTPDGPNSVLKELQDARIAVTVLMAGSGLGMNFVNRQQNGKWLNFSEARSFGLTGLPTSEIVQADSWEGGGLNSNSFVDYRSCCSSAGCNCATDHCPCGSDETAFLNYGQPGYLFRRPIGVFAELALKTGGYLCQLLPQGDVANYETTYPRYLTAAYREGVQAGNKIAVAPEYFDSDPVTGRGAYAAKCAQLTLGLNPFTLVQEE
jgi:hypothetical protein